MKIQDNYPGGNRLWFNGLYLDDEMMIFSACNFNGLFQYNLEEKRLMLLGKFENDNIFGKQLYGKVHRYKNILFFVPLGSFHIALYDLQSGLFRSVALPIPQYPCGHECKFLNSVMYGNSVFMFPGYASYIVEYDFDKEEVTVHDEWYMACVKAWGKRSNLLFNFDMVCLQDEVYLPSAQYGGIFQYHLKNGSYQFIDIPCQCKNIATLAYDGEYFWACTDNGLLLKLDARGELCKKIDMRQVYQETGPFVYSSYDGKDLWLFFSQKSAVMRINPQNPEHGSQLIRYADEERKYTNYEYHVVDFVEAKGRCIYFLSRSDREIKCILDGTVGRYLESIQDTTGYSEEELGGTVYYREYLIYRKICTEYLHLIESKVLNEQIPFSETLDFMMDGIRDYDQKKLETLRSTNIGKKVLERCMQG